MSVWIKYRLGWYDLLCAPSAFADWIRYQGFRIREFGIWRWFASFALMLVLQWTLLEAVRAGLWLNILQVFVASVANIGLYAKSLLLMIAMILAFDRFQRVHSVMSATVLSVFKADTQTDDTDNIVLWPTRAPLIGAIGLVTLILTVPFFATLEEIIFRMLPNPYLSLLLPATAVEFISNSVMGVIIWSILVFGLVHLYSGSRLGDALALGLVGGSWFALQNALHGISVAAISHANYNLVAIAFMISPRFQQVVTAAINAGLESLGRPRLGQ